jgi:hypothetical protein
LNVRTKGETGHAPEGRDRLGHPTDDGRYEWRERRGAVHRIPDILAR